MTCEKAAQVHAYYDGELDASRDRMFEAHLQRCAECSALLAELRELSSLLSSAPRAELPAQAMLGFHGAWHVARDRGIMRIAAALTAVAAMLLVGALLTGPPAQGNTPAKPALWEAMAVMPPTETQGEANSDLVQVAQWMADDLSLDERR
jgi:anti-sigma factor RsiW